MQNTSTSNDSRLNRWRPKGRQHTAPHFGGAPAVRLAGVSKRFGPTQALSDISIELAVGEVHALVGENGAGKSTCLSVMAGRISPDTGSVEISGVPLSPATPATSRRLGVAAIYQELTSFPDLTALENVFVGGMPGGTGLVEKGSMRKRFKELVDAYDLHIDPSAYARDLSVAQRQLLEILRGLNTDAKIMLFDEPTASLGTVEREALHRMIRDLRANGKAIAFVSHDLDEVLDLSDRITVFRDGRKVAQSVAGKWTKGDLIRQMLGQELKAPSHAVAARGGSAGAFRVEGLTVPGVIDDISFSVRRNEVLGVSGLVGSGRTSLLSALAGLFPHASGTITVDGKTGPVPRSPRAAQRTGMVLLPEDRRRLGLFMDLSAEENIVVATFPKHSRGGLISRRSVRRTARKHAEKTNFATARLRLPASSFSGGNQQKLLFAQALDRDPKVLLADEPTRGIDIGAKSQILNQVRELADSGIPTVLVSSDLEELGAAADRVLVLREGKAVGVFDCHASDFSWERILHLSFESEGFAA